MLYKLYSFLCRVLTIIFSFLFQQGFHSIVLMALVDASYRFMYIDVGANGSCSDGGVFKDSGLWESLEEGHAGLPDPEPIPGDDHPLPYSIVADDAFGLRTWLMKPYPHHHMARSERIFNYRLSRARRVVENAFGILVHRFRCMLTTMQQKHQNVQIIVMAACVMHNLLSVRRPMQLAGMADLEDPDTHELVPGSWREDQEVLHSMRKMGGNTSLKAAKLMRDYLKEYYNSEAGSVSWQDNMI